MRSRTQLGHEVRLARQGGQHRSTAVNKRAGSSTAVVLLVSYWVPDFWDKPRDLASVGLAEMEERGTACFETQALSA